MPKLVQICGINATGKTTLMRRLISENGSLARTDLGGHEVLTNGRLAVLGRYNDSKCCGIDGYIRDKNELAEYIRSALQKRIAQTVLFESVIYGLTYQFRRNVNGMCLRAGYSYNVVELIAPAEVLEQRIYQRNGGKAVNMEQIFVKQKHMIRAGMKLQKDGIKVTVLDANRLTEQQVYERVAEICGV